MQAWIGTFAGTRARATMRRLGSYCETIRRRREIPCRAPPKDVKAARRPLLVIDGDSFAHRSYHALPKTILGRDGKPAGAILGFANVLLRLYRAEQPRAVLVAWDTLEVPTARHTKFPAY